MASPFTIIQRRDETEDIEAIVDIIERNHVKQVIAGLPRSMNGSLSKQAEKVIAFVQKLEQHSKVPIEFRDERLTTVSAKRIIRATSSKKNRLKAEDDAIAAAILLQGYLDETTNR